MEQVNQTKAMSKQTDDNKVNLTKCEKMPKFAFKTTVLDCIKKYIRYKSNNKKKANKEFSHLITVINKYQKIKYTLYPIVVDQFFYNTWHFYLQGWGMSPLTIIHLTEQLRTVVKWASKYGVRLSDTFDEYYMDKAPAARMRIALSQDDINRIMHFNIDELECHSKTKETFKRVRDMFVLDCYLGQGYSNLIHISKSNFKDGVFNIVQKQTGNNIVIDLKEISAYPEIVKEILEKYNYKAPYSCDISNYNKHLHKLFFLAGFTETVRYAYYFRGFRSCKILKEKTFQRWQLISSYTARCTMISNAVKNGKSHDKIMYVTGHKTRAVFKKNIPSSRYDYLSSCQFSGYFEKENWQHCIHNKRCPKINCIFRC